MNDNDALVDGLRAFIARSVRDELAKLATPTPEDYLSTSEAAKVAKVAPATIRRWMKDGKLREHRAGRLVRISRSDLERLIREGRPRNDSSTPEQLARRKYG